MVRLNIHLLLFFQSSLNIKIKSLFINHSFILLLHSWPTHIQIPYSPESHWFCNIYCHHPIADWLTSTPFPNSFFDIIEYRNHHATHPEAHSDQMHGNHLLLTHPCTHPLYDIHTSDDSEVTTIPTHGNNFSLISLARTTIQS